MSLQRPECAPLRSARFCTLASVRWVLRHRAYTPWYLVRYLRFLRFKLRNPHVITRGFVFMDRGVELYARRGHGRLILGRWLHLGAHTALRCHEGTLSLGDKGVLARDVSVNCYLDVEIGDSALIADNVYISDFDHKFADLEMPIKDQGIAKARVRIERNVWLGTKVTIARGVTIGEGAVVGANAVVTRDLPAFCVAVGMPARVIRTVAPGPSTPTASSVLRLPPRDRRPAPRDRRAGTGSVVVDVGTFAPTLSRAGRGHRTGHRGLLLGALSRILSGTEHHASAKGAVPPNSAHVTIGQTTPFVGTRRGQRLDARGEST